MNSPDTRLAVLETRLDRIEKSIESIDASLRTLVRIEARHEAFEARLATLEHAHSVIREEMPALKQIKNWVYGAIGAVIISIAVAFSKQ